MAADNKGNVLLSTLEEIKKENQGHVPQDEVAGVAPAVAPAKPRKGLPMAGLLDSLLDEVKAEAEREVSEITKTLEEKSALERRQSEEEERRKKEQYDKLIQEEARRRLQLIKRKEDERQRLEDEQKRQAQERQRIVELKRRQERNRKVLLAATGLAAAGLVAVVVLVVTGVIPLLEGPPSATGEQVQAQAAAEEKKVVAKKKEPAYTGPEIVDPELPAEVLVVEGPGAVVLAIPERWSPEELALRELPSPDRSVAINGDEMKIRLTKAFSGVSTSSGGSSGGSSSSDGGIKINDNIFKD